jgi:mono/diheme cytochrome c family protein
VRWTSLILLLALTGCASPPPAAAAAQSADPLAQGHQIYVAKCAKCHKFYDPANYSDQEWKIWMQKMSRKAKLKPEQEKALTQYIDQTLRPKK